jgi:hypothetical protein
MLTLLQFEIFDPAAGQLGRAGRITAPPDHFVAEVDRRFQKRPLKPHKDYSRANSCGSRGITANYFLETGKLYEVQCNLNWRKKDHYYCIVENGTIKRLTLQEAVQWLNEH